LKKVILIILGLVLAIGITILFYNLLTINIDGYLTGYEKESDNNGRIAYTSKDSFKNEMKSYNIPDNVINDMVQNRFNYSIYWIDVNIKNEEGNSIYELKNSLEGVNDRIWITSDLSKEFQYNMESGEEYNLSIRTIIKTEGLDNSQIDGLIKNVSIRISARKYEYIPIWGSKVFNFPE